MKKIISVLSLVALVLGILVDVDGVYQSYFKNTSSELIAIIHENGSFIDSPEIQSINYKLNPNFSPNPDNLENEELSNSSLREIIKCSLHVSLESLTSKENILEAKDNSLNSLLKKCKKIETNLLSFQIVNDLEKNMKSYFLGKESGFFPNYNQYWIIDVVNKGDRVEKNVILTLPEAEIAQTIMISGKNNKKLHNNPNKIMLGELRPQEIIQVFGWGKNEFTGDKINDIIISSETGKGKVESRIYQDNNSPSSWWRSILIGLGMFGIGLSLRPPSPQTSFKNKNETIEDEETNHS